MRLWLYLEKMSRESSHSLVKDVISNLLTLLRVILDIKGR